MFYHDSAWPGISISAITLMPAINDGEQLKKIVYAAIDILKPECNSTPKDTQLKLKLNCSIKENFGLPWKKKNVKLRVPKEKCLEHANENYTNFEDRTHLSFWRSFRSKHTREICTRKQTVRILENKEILSAKNQDKPKNMNQVKHSENRSDKFCFVSDSISLCSIWSHISEETRSSLNSKDCINFIKILDDYKCIGWK